jgi:hypothetical protein
MTALLDHENGIMPGYMRLPDLQKMESVRPLGKIRASHEWRLALPCGRGQAIVPRCSLL